MSDVKVGEQALRLLVDYYDSRGNLCAEIPYIQLLQLDGIMDVLVENFTNIYKQIFEQKSKIIGIKDPERNCAEVVNIFSSINNCLTKLNQIISFKLDD